MASRPPRAPIAGGVLIAIGSLAGAFIGAPRGQASFGFVVGLGIAVVLALLIWLLDRR